MLPTEQDIRSNPLTSCAVDLSNEVEAAVDRLILIVLPTKTSRRLLVVAIEWKASVVVARTPTSRKTATLEMRTIGDKVCVCKSLGPLLLCSRHQAVSVAATAASEMQWHDGFKQKASWQTSSSASKQASAKKETRRIIVHAMLMS